MPMQVTVEIDGVDQLAKAMRGAPPELRKRLTKAMRLAAGPARTRAAAAVAWSDRVTIRARRDGAAVGSPRLVPPIIEFGNKAVVPAGKVRPHVRKLHRQPHLIDAVESQLPAAAAIADRELGALLDTLLARYGALSG